MTQIKSSVHLQRFPTLTPFYRMKMDVRYKKLRLKESLLPGSQIRSETISHTPPSTYPLFASLHPIPLFSPNFFTSILARMKYLKPFQMYQYLTKLKGFNERPLLGMDVGKTFIGVSISDAGHQIAQPLRSFNRDEDDLPKELGQLISYHKLSGIVLGWPTYNLLPAKNALVVKNFAEKLKQMQDFDDFHFTVWNENYTTKNVEFLIKPLNYIHGEEKSDLDMFAASCILQGYLDFLKCDKSRLKPWSLEPWSPDL